MSFEIEPIGVVEAARAEPTDDEWGGSEASIRLAPGFEASALAEIESFSHVEVLFVFDRVPDEKIERGARHPRGRTEWPAVGIFAQRGKNRPNRIGSTICRVVRAEGPRLVVAELDAIDGTPVIDLKPVMKEFLPRGPVFQPVWSHELMAAYWSEPGEGGANADGPVPTFGLNHVSLCVADPEVSLRFYERLLGVRESFRDENGIQALGPGPHDVLAFDRREPGREKGGIDHFGFRLVRPNDVEHARRAAEAAGAKILRQGEFGPSQPYLYVEDPDGHVIEIWYE